MGRQKRVIPEGEPTLIKVDDQFDNRKMPSVGVSFLTILLPVILMLFGTFAPYLPSQ